MENIQSFTKFLNEAAETGKSQVNIKQYEVSRIDLPDVRKEIELAIKRGDKVHMSLTKDRFAVLLDKNPSTRAQYNIKPIDADQLGVFGMFQK
jgi:hypothetical protein